MVIVQTANKSTEKPKITMKWNRSSAAVSIVRTKSLNGFQKTARRKNTTVIMMMLKANARWQYDASSGYHISPKIPPAGIATTITSSKFQKLTVCGSFQHTRIAHELIP